VTADVVRGYVVAAVSAQQKYEVRRVTVAKIGR